MSVTHHIYYIPELSQIEARHIFLFDDSIKVCFNSSPQSFSLSKDTCVDKGAASNPCKVTAKQVALKREIQLCSSLFLQTTSFSTYKFHLLKKNFPGRGRRDREVNRLRVTLRTLKVEKFKSNFAGISLRCTNDHVKHPDFAWLCVQVVTQPVLASMGACHTSSGVWQRCSAKSLSSVQLFDSMVSVNEITVTWEMLLILYYPLLSVKTRLLAYLYLANTSRSKNQNVLWTTLWNAGPAEKYISYPHVRPNLTLLLQLLPKMSSFLEREINGYNGPL